MAIRPKVLFLCSEIVSAGSEAGCLDPEAVAAMREVGIDIALAQAKSVNPYLGKRFQYVITLCDRQKERSCPIFPGAFWRQTWPIESPIALTAAGLDHGFAVRRARDEIRRHIVEFVEKYHQPHKYRQPHSSKGKSA